MRLRIFFLSTLLLLSTRVNADNETKIPAQLNTVTVFATGAQLFHTTNYNVKAGVSTIIIENVAPRLDMKSIQVKMSGSVILLDAKFRVYSNSSDQFSGLNQTTVRQLKSMSDSLKMLAIQIRTKTETIEVLYGSKQIILNNGAVKGQGKVNDSIEFLQKTVDYYQKKLMEINASIASNGREYDALKEKETQLATRYSELKEESGFVNQKGVPQIVLTVQSEAVVSGKIDFSYMISEAGWTPVYDLQSSVDDGKVNLNYKAFVHQNSGLKWNNVNLTISTNNPRVNKTKPELHPWYASFQNFRVSNNSNSQNMATGAQHKLSAEVSNSKLEKVGYTSDRTLNDFVQIVNNGISAEYRIALPYTLESNNQEYTVLIKNVDLVAKYSYYAVPKLDKSAYLVAQVNKIEDLNLIPGKANIFFEGGYVGETYIDPSQLDDTLRLSLGYDPNIIVKRTYLTQDKKEKILGNYVEKSEFFFIEVRNQKANNIEVIIQDQIPLSQLNEVTIELIDSGKATYNEVTGLLEWRKVIKPRQSEQIKFGFKIKQPKDQKIYY